MFEWRYTSCESATRDCSGDRKHFRLSFAFSTIDGVIDHGSRNVAVQYSEYHSGIETRADEMSIGTNLLELDRAFTWGYDFVVIRPERGRDSVG
jgi:hypothetical protein